MHYKPVFSLKCRENVQYFQTAKHSYFTIVCHDYSFITDSNLFLFVAPTMFLLCFSKADRQTMVYDFQRSECIVVPGTTHSLITGRSNVLPLIFTDTMNTWPLSRSVPLKTQATSTCLPNFQPSITTVSTGWPMSVTFWKGKSWCVSLLAATYNTIFLFADGSDDASGDNWKCCNK